MSGVKFCRASARKIKKILPFRDTGEIVLKKLLIVDGNSILNRAFYGIRPLTSHTGLNTNALFGFLRTLIKQLSEVAPDYAAVAFDLKSPTFRHKLYDGYKAGRRAMPDELAEQLPYAKKLAELLGFGVLTLEGYEADDIIGTVASFAERVDSLNSYVLTGDRDMLQLINSKIGIILVSNTETLLYDENRFAEKYGVSPSAYVDVKALMGDTSDNIPGVPGVGEKTAFKLIAEHGSLQALYDSLDSADIKPAVRTKLENGEALARLSYKLALIDKNAPIGLELEDIRYRGPNREPLFKLFDELDFRSFREQAEKLSGSASASDTESNFEDRAEYFDLNPDEIDEFVNDKSFALTLYRDGDTYRVGISDDGRRNAVAALDIGRLKALVTKHAAAIISCDTKALCTLCEDDTLHFGFDCALAAYIDNSAMRTISDLPSGSRDGVRYTLEKLVGYCTKDTSIDTSEPEKCAASLYNIAEVLKKRLNDSDCLSLLYNIEQPLAAVLSDIERRGFKIDPAGLLHFSDALGHAADELRAQIYALAGCEFNINSPKQLGEVLFERLKLPGGKKTKSGYSTAAEILEKLAPFYPIVALILNYRHATKLKSTYADALPELADKNGIVRTSFNQTGTATGRLSSSSPNLQNIPIRTELGHELRRYFIPHGDGRVLIDADYSQIELRLLAGLSGDENMIRAFSEGKDIHADTASRVFNVPFDEVTPELRKRAKAVNFGIVYGISDFSLAQDLGVSKKEAAAFIDEYLKNYPKIKKYLDESIEKAKRDGYVTTYFGRRRLIPELSSGKAMLKKFGERVAMNSPIQGTAADVIKLAMIKTHTALKTAGLDAAMILQVHDELILDSAESCADEALALLKQAMESALSDFPVPLTCETSVGKTWFDCK